MAPWPFGKRKNPQEKPISESSDKTGQSENSAPVTETLAHEDSNASGPVAGKDFGPFDGDTVDYREFDFSDFAKGGLDLGSMMVPVPHDGEVQVEMGENGPQMVHIVTPVGRITPVAFAAPRGEDLWADSVPEIVTGMANDDLETELVEGPWGDEIVADAGDGAMRVIGAPGARWMLRMTIAGPKETATQLAELTREVMGRTFVMRGTDPIPAGNPLPVQLPQAMVEELAKHLQQRKQQQENNGGTTPNQTSSERK